MALNRKDTPLANTTDPGKGNFGKANILPGKIDPSKMKLVDTKNISRDSINNGRVVGRITETISTFKGGSRVSTPTRTSTPVKKTVAPTKKTVVPAKKTVVPAKKTVEETKIVKSKTFEPSKTEEAPVVTPKVDETRLTPTKTNSSIEERREAMRVKTFEKWRKPNESRSDYDARIKASTEENAAKNTRKANVLHAVNKALPFFIELEGTKVSPKGASSGCSSC